MVYDFNDETFNNLPIPYIYYICKKRIHFYIKLTLITFVESCSKDKSSKIRRAFEFYDEKCITLTYPNQ